MAIKNIIIDLVFKLEAQKLTSKKGSLLVMTLRNDSTSKQDVTPLALRYSFKDGRTAMEAINFNGPQTMEKRITLGPDEQKTLRHPLQKGAAKIEIVVDEALSRSCGRTGIVYHEIWSANPCTGIRYSPAGAARALTPPKGSRKRNVPESYTKH